MIQNFILAMVFQDLDKCKNRKELVNEFLYKYFKDITPKDLKIENIIMDNIFADTFGCKFGAETNMWKPRYNNVEYNITKTNVDIDLLWTNGENYDFMVNFVLDSSGEIIQKRRSIVI